MNWLYYLLEANLYLVLFYGFYLLFLQNETFYSLNRYFLLLATLVSFLLPMLQIGLLKPFAEQKPINDTITAVRSVVIPHTQVNTAQNYAHITDIDWFYIAYFFISFCFTIHLILSLYRILKIWLNAKKHSLGAITLVELTDNSAAFSFFNLLFIHPQLIDKPTVIKHEMVHIKQKHSLDVMFFELIHIICWFNPIIYFVKKDIKLLHEYIADELTTIGDIQKHEYALFLIQNSFGLKVQPITNQIFNQSILKSRIKMLNKKRTASKVQFRLLLALPLLMIMLCISTISFTKEYGYLDLLPHPIKEPIAHQVNLTPLEISQPKWHPTPSLVANKKTDTLAFISTSQPKNQNYFKSSYRLDHKTGNPIRIKKRYIVINGIPLKNQQDFYGATNAKTITYLNPIDAVKKYGNIATAGAVEITGDKILFTYKISPPPPYHATKSSLPIDKIQPSPPPQVQNNEKAKKWVNVSSYVNGTPDKYKLSDFTKAELLKYSNTNQAKETFGKKEKYGAVEIDTSNHQDVIQNDQKGSSPPKVMLSNKVNTQAKVVASVIKSLKAIENPKKKQVINVKAVEYNKNKILLYLSNAALSSKKSISNSKS